MAALRIEEIYTDADLCAVLCSDVTQHELVPAHVALVGVHLQMVARNDSTVASDAAPFSTLAALPWQLTAVAVAIPSVGTYVIHTRSLSTALLCGALRTLLQDPRKIKVLCDVHQAASWLHTYGLRDLQLRKCVDLQLLYELYVDQQHHSADMKTIGGYCGLAASSSGDLNPQALTHLLHATDHWFTAPPPPPSPRVFGNQQRAAAPAILPGEHYISICALPSFAHKSPEEHHYDEYLRRRSGPSAAPTLNHGAQQHAVLPSEPAAFVFGNSSHTQAPVATFSSPTAAVMAPLPTPSVFEYQALAASNESCASFTTPTQSMHGVSTCALSGVTGVDIVLQTEMSTDPLAWHRPSVSMALVRLLATAAHQLPASMIALAKKRAVTVLAFDATALRWDLAVQSNGHRSIWFSVDDAHVLRPTSLELLCPFKTVASARTFAPQLRVECALMPLLTLLPSQLQSHVMGIPSFTDSLVSICLDVGRAPLAYTTASTKRVVALGTDTVSTALIASIVQRLGGEQRFSHTNHVGLGQHRIAVLRTTTTLEVVSVTLRVGRAVWNAAAMLLDVLESTEHARKSILVLGPPVSGKTTLLRDIVRCISRSDESVCVIDTANELGGDDTVPHPSMGRARRIMVQAREEQARTMLDYVQQHHRVDSTVVVDEIHSVDDVTAVGALRQRGCRVIAGAQGDLHSLIQFSALCDVLGSVHAHNGGLCRTRAPLFDIVVELDAELQGTCRIIWDAGQAVDSILAGRPYAFETRHFDVSTLGIYDIAK